MIRKRILPPPMPEPEKRLAEIKIFSDLLVNRFIDYDCTDVYNSVFRDRVNKIMDTIVWEKETGDNANAILEFGTYIQAVNSTKTRDFTKFFKLILDYFESED